MGGCGMSAKAKDLADSIVAAVNVVAEIEKISGNEIIDALLSCAVLFINNAPKEQQRADLYIFGACMMAENVKASPECLENSRKRHGQLPHEELGAAS